MQARLQLMRMVDYYTQGANAFRMATSLNPRDQISDDDSKPRLVIIPRQAQQPQILTNGLKDINKWLYFPDANQIVKIILGAYVANCLPGRPVWPVIVGASASGKTELLEALAQLPNVHYSGDLTKASIMSGKKNKDGQLEMTGGLLYDVGNFGFVVFPELSNVLSMDHRSQGPTLGLMRQMFDGRVTREIGGEDGGKLSWRGKIAIFAASTQSIENVRTVMQEMGERFIYTRLEANDDRIGELQIDGINQDWDEGRHVLTCTVYSILKNLLDKPAVPALTREQGVQIHLLARFSARCRSTVERNTSWERSVESVHPHEGSGRLFNSMAALLRGMLAIGCTDADAWRALISVMWDSIPQWRALVIRAIAANTDPLGTEYVRGLRKLTDLTTEQLGERKGVERAVARAAEDLVLHGVLEVLRNGKRGVATGWRLAEDTWTRYAQIDALGSLRG